MSGLSPVPAPVGPNKAYAAAIAGAITTIAVWALASFTHVNPPADVVAAFQTILTIAVVYFTPHGG